VPKSMTIQRKLRVFANSSLQVQILDTAVNLITRQPVFLLKLRAIAAGNDSANREFDPILVLFWLLFRGRSDGLLIARPAVKPSGNKNSRKNQQQESARGGIHNIQINI